MVSEPAVKLANQIFVPTCSYSSRPPAARPWCYVMYCYSSNYANIFSSSKTGWHLLNSSFVFFCVFKGSLLSAFANTDNFFLSKWKCLYLFSQYKDKRVWLTGNSSPTLNGLLSVSMSVDGWLSLSGSVTKCRISGHCFEKKYIYIF